MKRKELALKNQEGLVPGFGVAGQVMCPFSMMAPKMCMKQGCELWVELNYVDRKVARCSLAWLAVLSTEIRGAIDKLGLVKPRKGKK